MADGQTILLHRADEHVVAHGVDQRAGQDGETDHGDLRVLHGNTSEDEIGVAARRVETRRPRP